MYKGPGWKSEKAGAVCFGFTPFPLEQLFSPGKRKNSPSLPCRPHRYLLISTISCFFPSPVFVLWCNSRIFCSKRSGRMKSHRLRSAFSLKQTMQTPTNRKRNPIMSCSLCGRGKKQLGDNIQAVNSTPFPSPSPFFGLPWCQIKIGCVRTVVLLPPQLTPTFF